MHLLGHRIGQIGNDALDQDEYIEEWKEKEPPKWPKKPETIKITVKSGCVESVEGLPPFYDYEINDLDSQEE